MSNSPIKSVLVYGSVAPNVCNACVLHLTGMANALAAQGLEVTLMAPYSAAEDPLSQGLSHGVRTETFGWPKVFSKTIWTLGPVKSGLKFCRYLKEHKPDLIYVRTNLLTWPLHWYAGRLGIPSVAEHNGIIAVELSNTKFGRILAPLATWLQRLSCKYATYSRAVTEGMKGQLIDMGAKADKVFVLGNGTDVSQLQRLPRKESLDSLNLEEDRFYVGFLGSLSWWQGVHTLIDAVNFARKSVPNLHLLIGGDGAELSALKAQAGKLGILEHVTFLGYVDFSTRLNVLSAMDITTLPACAQRNKKQGVSPLKVRDYAAVGAVILAADLPGLEHMAEQGALVTHVPDDASDLGQKIVNLHADLSMRATLSQNSRRYAEENYSWDLIARQLLNQVKVLN